MGKNSRSAYQSPEPEAAEAEKPKGTSILGNVFMGCSRAQLFRSLARAACERRFGSLEAGSDSRYNEVERISCWGGSGATYSKLGLFPAASK